MSTTRNFTGSRSSKSMGEAARLKKLEILKGGTLPITQAERYKMILDKKLQESKMNAAMAGPARQMSKKAEDAIKEVARRKAIKEEKALRKMVAILPRSYSDNMGFFAQLNKKGDVYDEVGNLVLKVNGKKGTVENAQGFRLGKYKPKSSMHVAWMRQWIMANSPYHLRLRQLEYQRQVQLMYENQNGVASSLNVNAPAVGGVWGMGDEASAGARGNMGVTVYGVMSNNVHGTFGENAWGGFADNVWGTASSNIWGGIGDPGPAWGRGSFKIWGSGAPGQKNYLKGIGGMIAALFGWGSRSSNYRSGRTAGRTGGRT